MGRLVKSMWDGIGFPAARETVWGTPCWEQSDLVVISAQRGSGCFCYCRPWRSAGHWMRRGLRMPEIMVMWVGTEAVPALAGSTHARWFSCLPIPQGPLGLVSGSSPRLVEGFCLSPLRECSH